MINVIINGKSHSIKENTKVLDLIKVNSKKYFVCKIGGQIKELTYKLTERHNNKEIEFLGLEQRESSKVYETTLRYIIGMAFYRLYPNLKIKFSNFVSRSTFCEVLTPNISLSSIYHEIEKEVKNIIESDLPIERIKVPVEVAKDIYIKQNMLDKLEVLPYRPESTVNLYKCGDYYDYLHNYMVPSTGYIFDFKLRPFSPGLIIQYPRDELGAQIPEFHEESTYGRTLKKAYQWAKLQNCHTVSNINKKIEESNLIITHAGTGVIINAIKKQKKVIGIPRLKIYNEHVDDHQIQLIHEFKELNFIEAVYDINELENAIKLIKEKEYNKYISNTINIIKSIEKFIEQK
jgi:uridine kinase